MVRSLAATCVTVVLLVFTGSAAADVTVAPGGGTPGTSENFELVGHAPLSARGMNAAPALYRDWAYVGYRSDGSDYCEDGQTRGCEHRRPGVEILDISRPRAPRVVGEIGPPYAGQVGITTRELRVWPREKLLIVMSFRCTNALHACPPGTDADFAYDLKFFDLENPREPRFITSYVPTSRAGAPAKPHEMQLWVDPDDRDRALLYVSTPEASTDPSKPNLVVIDISDVADGGAVRHVAEANFNSLYEPQAPEPLRTHSMGVSADGKRTHLANLGGTYLLADSSEVAEGRPNAQLRAVSDVRGRPSWPNPEHHSSFEVPGRPFTFNTDEVYGTLVGEDHGCPWGWARLMSFRDTLNPEIVGQYKLKENLTSFCSTPMGMDDERNSYASHNPTSLRRLTFVTWHSGGLQAVDTRRPRTPEQAGWFSPQPLDDVALEDPALSMGPNKVVMWSFPIIKDGLIYVVDIRNGLYVLRYTGPERSQVRNVKFLEGNSNLGDALRLSGVAPDG